MNIFEYTKQIKKAESDLQWLKSAFWKVREHLTNNPEDIANLEKQLIEIKTLHDTTEDKIKELHNKRSIEMSIIADKRRQEIREAQQKTFSTGHSHSKYVDPCITHDLAYDRVTGMISLNGGDYFLFDGR